MVMRTVLGKGMGVQEDFTGLYNQNFARQTGKERDSKKKEKQETWQRIGCQGSEARIG